MSLRDQRGQAAVLSFVFLTSLLGMCAAVLDVGSWYRADRALQATADAAALAGAQALPHDPGRALALADEYLAKNGGAAGTSVSLASRFEPNDTVRVEVADDAPGVFSRLLGIDSAGVEARAAARASALSQARYVAPIVVNIRHPLMPGGASGRCRPDPCFGEGTELELINLHSPGAGDAAGAFGLINLLGDGSGSAGSAEVASWMEDGFDAYMALGSYNSVPSTMFNSSHFHSALAHRTGSEVLFPIYDRISGSGSNAVYNIIGWVGFHISSWKGRGSDGVVRGHFTRVVWQGIAVEAGGPDAYGARVISLVE